MERTSTESIRIARIGLVAVFAWSVFRAVTQSVTVGEAWNYDQYIGPTWRDALAHMDANNHFLNTLLVRIATARMHLTELSLRLPSLLSGALYLWAAYRLTRRWFGEGRMFLAVLGLLALNPVVLDAMSEARGYGMALACWIWAVELVAGGGSTAVAGALLGLSVAGSLAFAAPAVALILVAAVRRKLGYMPQVALLTAFVLLVLPLNHADMGLVTKGATSLRQTLNLLTQGSLDTDDRTLAAIVRVGIGILAAVGLVGLLRRSTKALTYIIGGSLVVSLALVKLAHGLAGAAFPEGGAIYLIPMVTLFAGLLVQGWGREKVEVAFVVVAAFCCAHYADHLRLAYRGAGEMTGGKELAKVLRADAMRRGVSVGVSAQAEPIVRYYRWRYRQANWEAIERLGSGHFDYYVLSGGDTSRADAGGLKVLYRDAGLVLAK